MIKTSSLPLDICSLRIGEGPSSGPPLAGVFDGALRRAHGMWCNSG